MSKRVMVFAGGSNNKAMSNGRSYTIWGFNTGARPT